MALTKSNGLGIGGAVGAVAVLVLGWVVACGSDFAGDDCKATRTCPTAGGAQGDEPATQAGTAAQEAGGSDAGVGGAGAPEAGSAGAAGAADEMCEASGTCQPANAPPTVVAVSPLGDATGVDPTAQIVITFSEPLAESTVTPDNIKLFDGGAAVPGKLAYADGQVTFVPDAPLALFAPYAVSVAATVTDAQGAPLPEAYSSTFRTRDGVWHASNAVTDTLYQIADTLPIAANGDVLVSWIARSPGSYCPTSARWFNRGKGVSATAVLAPAGVTDCNWVAAGANAAGVGAVAWQEDYQYVRQFRAGQWLAERDNPTKNGASGRYSLGVAPDGSVSFVQQHAGGGTFASRTDSSGKWTPTPDTLSSSRGLSAARIAFDVAGDGFAVWRAQDASNHEQILVSRYATKSAKWAAATALPGSTASTPNTQSADFERGAPTVAVDNDGGAMALWVSENGAGESALMASRFLNGTWAAPTVISGAVLVPTLKEPPALVFDGKAYVAAWTGQDDTAVLTYSARFDLEFNQFEPFEQRSPLPTNLPRMPQLGADAHQNLLLVWAKQKTEGGSLVFQRYDALNETWSAQANVPGGTVSDDTFVSSGPMPLSVNAAGLGALMWGDKNDEKVLSTLRLVSFY